MAFKIPNIDFIRSISTSEQLAEAGPKIAEALQAIALAHDNVVQQVNGNSTGQPVPPPAINALKVSGQNGHFNIAVHDDNEIYRDAHYYVEHADNPQFTNPTVVHMGHSRNHNLFLGNVTRYFRAYSGYPGSEPGKPAYHGDEGTPLPVEGGGIVGGPAFLESQSSGTGTPGQGLTGSGPIPFRSKTGVPPVR